MKRPKTNIEFVTEFMNFSSQGALAQLFVIQALNYYAATVIKNQDQLRKDMKGGFINAEAWIRTAHEYERKAEEQFKPSFGGNTVNDCAEKGTAE